MTVSEAEVWRAYDAFTEEMSCWRVVSWREGGALAVRDQLSRSSDAVFERHDFSGSEMAERYVHWRSMQAALEALL